MIESWKQLENQLVNGRFHLRRYLGDTEHSVVFLAGQSDQARDVAIKFIPAAEEDAAMSRWRLAAQFSHPRLIRLFETGRWRIEDLDLSYAVMEYADENLGQILPQRSLTLGEAREVLPPILNALSYLHSQGCVHGRIKPANIMSVRDQLKVSIDGVSPISGLAGGSRTPSPYDAPEMARGEVLPAADVWSLGITLMEALTQRLPVWEGREQQEPSIPETFPAEFRELVQHCLRIDVQNRWTVAEIATRLPPESRAPQAAPPSAATPPIAPAQAAVSDEAHKPTTRRIVWNRRYAAPIVALGLILVAVLLSPKLLKQPSPASVTPTQNAPQEAPIKAAPEPTPPAAPPAKALPGADSVPGEVMHRVLPEIPAQARRTISGTVRVGIRVRVGPLGNVERAEVESRGPSRYFAELALKAARRWKFSPPKADGRNAESEWILRFHFGRAGTTVLPVRIRARS